MSLLANSNAIESGGYPIQRSLRFRSSASAYLSRTPASASNRKTWTWSGWVKRGSLGTEQSIFATVSQGFSLFFGTGNDLRVWTNGGNAAMYTSAVYRDVGAWYHIVLQRTSVSPYFNLYVNGTQVTAFAYDNRTTYPGTADSEVNNTVAHYISGFTSYYFDGYLAEVNFIDGQALTPSSFGYTEPLTGVWQPLKYMDTYGTNGFYLPFSDNTSATTLAYDKSGNGNNWTPNNISTTSGATYDSMTDVPTLTSATAANYCVLNPLYAGGGATIANGNLDASGSSGYSVATFAPTSGKYYFEVTCNLTSPTVNDYFGIRDIYGAVSIEVYWAASGATGGMTGSPTFSTYTTGDVLACAFDCDSNTVAFYKNGTVQGTGNYTPTTTIVGKSMTPEFKLAAGRVGSWQSNFGQRPFSFSAPTGFLPLNTFNLP